MITRHFECDTCEEEFEVTWDDEHTIRYCVFCGDLLDEDDDEDEDWDEDEWDDE